MIPTRMRNIKKILRDEKILRKLIHGSDLPVPSFPTSFPQMVPLKKLMEISRHKNPLEKDYLAKKAIGFPDHVFTRGTVVLE